MSALFLIFLTIPFSASVSLGPKFKPTQGAVWPRPQVQETKTFYYVLDRESPFRITKPHFTCDILEKGIKRLLHLNLARRQKYLRPKQKYVTYHKYFKGVYSWNAEFRIVLTEECENYPHLNMDEHYKLFVGKKILLSSASIWGILRGLQTFDHLLYYSNDYTEIRINATNITDSPAYSHRGLLIDTGRHYLRPQTIHTVLHGMEVNKLNVLHWHIVDDESFPYQSQQLPKLSEKGAFHPTMVYTKEMILEIIEHARLAGIRVIPEFDAPGHVHSWGAAYPDVLTECFDENDEVVALGSLNPISNTTHLILKLLYQEVTSLFPDDYVHLGGDEVDTDCWRSNLRIHNFKRQNGIKGAQLSHVLQTEFLRAVKSMLPKKSKYIVWQEIFDGDVPLDNKTIVQVWKRKEPSEEIIKILTSGHRLIFSSLWYLDKIDDTWETFYSIDPRHMVINASGADPLKIVGGEACMWGEYVDDTNILTRMWPRASAVAERLWTGADVNTTPVITTHTRRRMEEHACRMRRHNIPAEPPNGPGYCVGIV